METDVKTCKGDDESKQTLLSRYARLRANLTQDEQGYP